MAAESSYQREANAPTVALVPFADVQFAIQDQLRREFAKLEAVLVAERKSSQSDGWLDAKAAAAYMGVSRGTFDKYRYESTPRLTGYPLDGKVLYKRADIDRFVKLYSVKSGCAP